MSWSCASCTYKNAFRSTCEMCGANKPIAKRNNNNNRRRRGGKNKKTTFNNTTNKNNWTCSTCTFLNQKPLSLACEMCGTAKSNKITPATNRSNNNRKPMNNNRRKPKLQQQKQQVNKRAELRKKRQEEELRKKREEDQKRMEKQIQEKLRIAEEESRKKIEKLKEEQEKETRRKIQQLNEQKQREIEKQQKQFAHQKKQEEQKKLKNFSPDDPRAFKNYLPSSKRRELQQLRKKDRFEKFTEKSQKILSKNNSSNVASNNNKSLLNHQDSQKQFLKKHYNFPQPKSELDSIVYNTFLSRKKPTNEHFILKNNRNQPLPFVTIRKLRNEGSFLFGTRRINVQINQSKQPYVKIGSRNISLLSYVEQYEKIEAIKLKAFNSTNPLLF